jgi:hypothetical protein
MNEELTVNLFPNINWHVKRVSDGKVFEVFCEDEEYVRILIRNATIQESIWWKLCSIFQKILRRNG